MPSIPVYSTPQIQQRPLPQVQPPPQVSLPQAPDLSAPARAMSQMGERIQATGDKLFQVALQAREEDDRTAAKQAMVQWDTRTRQTLLTGDEQTPAYLNLRGEEALQAYDGVAQGLSKQREGMAQELPNERQRQMFLDATQGHYSHTLDSMARHQAEQRQVWQNDVSKAVQTNALNEALTMSQQGNERGVEEAIAAGVAETYAMALRAGKEQAVARDGKEISLPEQAAAQFESSTLRALVGQRAATDPLGAKTYFEQQRQRFTGSDAADLEGELAKPVQRQMVAQFTEEIRATTAPQAVPDKTSGSQAVSQDNNPGNLRAGPNTFQTFATPEEGVAATVKNLRNYPKKYGADTLEKIASVWAPSGDGDNNPAVWAKNVGKISDIDPKEPLDLDDPNTLRRLVPAIARQEKGNAKVGIFTPETVNAGVERALSGRTSPDSPLTAQFARADAIQDPILRDAVRQELASRHHQDTSIQAERERLTTEANAQTVSNLELAVDRLQADPEKIDQAADSGVITWGQRTQLRRRYDSILSEKTQVDTTQAALIARGIAALTGSALLDPQSTEDKKAADIVYQAQQWSSAAPDTLPAAKASFAGKLGIVPTALRAEIRGQLRAGSVAQKVSAADMLGRLQNTNPQLLNDFGGEDVRESVTIQNLVRAGVQPDQAVKMAEDQMRMPKAEQEALAATYRDTLGQGRQGTEAAKRVLAESFDPGWFSFEPVVPDYLAREFNDIVAGYYRGDLDAARQAALNDIRKVWGNSEITGNRVLMRDAPELHYGLPGKSTEDNATWMREQLLNELKETDTSSLSSSSLYQNAATHGFTLTPLPGGKSGPLYRIQIRRADGSFMPDSLPSWRPDWQSASKT